MKGENDSGLIDDGLMRFSAWKPREMREGVDKVNKMGNKGCGGLRSPYHLFREDYSQLYGVQVVLPFKQIS